MKRLLKVLLLLKLYAFIAVLVLFLHTKLATVMRDDISLKNQPTNRPRIYCIILTTKENLKTKAMVVFNAWASKCDNHTFVTLIPKEMLVNRSSGVHEILSGFYMLQPKELVVDMYSRLTDKVFWAFKHVFRKHAHYDWYLKADDDSFIHVDNLRRFLADKNPHTAVTYGYDYKKFVVGGYHSGGGYVLSRRAFTHLGEKLASSVDFCHNTGIEDVDVAACLRRLSVFSNSSLDTFGRERFHTLTLLESYGGNFPDWLYEWAKNRPRGGLDCCSDSWISFHHLPPKQIYQLGRIVREYSPRTYAQPDSANNAFRDVANAFSHFVDSKAYASFEPPQTERDNLF